MYVDPFSIYNLFFLISCHLNNNAFASAWTLVNMKSYHKVNDDCNKYLWLDWFKNI